MAIAMDKIIAAVASERNPFMGLSFRVERGTRGRHLYDAVNDYAIIPYY
jgi:hypothetical protein